MHEAARTVGTRRRVPITLIAAFAALSLGGLSLSGCAATPANPAAKPADKPAAAGTVASSTVSASDAQVCAECNKKGMGPKVVGAAVTDGGIQIVNVGIVNGYYSPNAITAKAGTPLRVVFNGKAKGCIGKPKFGALNKQVDITAGGTGTIDLGALEPGVYEFTCGMGMSKSTITVQ